MELFVAPAVQFLVLGLTSLRSVQAGRTSSFIKGSLSLTRLCGLNMMVALAQRIQDGNHYQQGLFDSVVGQIKTLEKRWIVDVDTKDEEELLRIMKVVNIARPEGNKIYATIPTKNGYHLITGRFDVLMFQNVFPHVDIQKKNPTLLYLPNSLND